MNHHLDPDRLHEWLEKSSAVSSKNEGNNDKSVCDFRQHFANWLRQQLEKQNKHPQSHENPATTNREESRQRRLDTITTALLSATMPADESNSSRLQAFYLKYPKPEQFFTAYNPDLQTRLLSGGLTPADLAVRPANPTLALLTRLYTRTAPLEWLKNTTRKPQRLH